MPDGFINVLKPSFMTSSDVVVKVRGILKKHYGEKVKVGHLGTLDPGGAGVLPVAIGKGARLFPYTDESVKSLPSRAKSYARFPLTEMLL